MSSYRRPIGALLGLLSLLGLLPTVFAREKAYIKGTGSDGVQRELDVSRKPALYTGDFADCLNGDSLFNVTKFDAAYYRDNMTVLFHLDGTTNIRNESIMMHISVEAYGTNRFNLTYDPCKANIGSLCPLNANVPVEAFAVISISPSDVAGIPSIALGIPDLEGFARLRIFANSTQTEIGCLQAIMTNGQSFSQPQAVGTIVGVFVFFAVVASFATAIYGIQVPHMRMHYAHSFSILVIFETFQSIYFSGALSVDWPSVLPAWWSNFAWTSGMFASDSMVHSISPFAGISGNSSQVGGAGSVPINNGGGLTQQIYGRAIRARSILELNPVFHSFARRAGYNSSDPYDYNWAGNPRSPGMPMPGTFTGFAGTLSATNVPAKDAFIVGLIWLLVIVGAVALFVAAIKFTLDLCIKFNLIKTDGFDYFRSHWLGYMSTGILRTIFIAFFAMMTLAMFQFSIPGAAGTTAIAAIVFLIFLIGMGGLVAYACYVRVRGGKYEVVPDSVRFEQGKLFKKVPFIATTRESSIGEEEQSQKPKLYGSVPIRRIKFTPNDPNRTAVHQDSEYLKRFGWLSARYRRTRWWFFAVYLGYQFVRACFIGGGSQSPLAQVYGLFVFEVFALVVIIKMKPFEGARNTSVAMWLLSISKIVTTGLSIAFLPSFNLDRIITTVLGIIIVVVQGFLAVAVLILIVLGMISTWMSLSRNREEFPEKLEGLRVRYFEHVEARAGDLPPPPKKFEEPQQPLQPYFNVRSVRRTSGLVNPNAFPPLMDGTTANNPPAPANPLNRRSRTNSASSRYSVSSLPRSGRTHRASWTAKDLAEWDAEMNRGDQMPISHMRNSSLRMQALKQQSTRPMTPTRESAEFIRVNSNVMRPEEKDAIAKGSIPEVADISNKRRSVTFADDQPGTSSSDGTKVGTIHENENDLKAKSTD
ncbi:Fc.00g036230.m01.CDS01 [Cosmosporella sp. VM-42]